MRWIDALKIWNGHHHSMNPLHVWATPRKGTPEHAEVMKIKNGEGSTAHMKKVKLVRRPAAGETPLQKIEREKTNTDRQTKALTDLQKFATGIKQRNMEAINKATNEKAMNALELHAEKIKMMNEAKKQAHVVASAPIKPEEVKRKIKIVRLKREEPKVEKDDDETFDNFIESLEETEYHDYEDGVGIEVLYPTSVIVKTVKYVYEGYSFDQIMSLMRMYNYPARELAQIIKDFYEDAYIMREDGKRERKDLFEDKKYIKALQDREDDARGEAGEAEDREDEARAEAQEAAAPVKAEEVVRKVKLVRKKVERLNKEEPLTENELKISNINDKIQKKMSILSDHISNDNWDMERVRNSEEMNEIKGFAELLKELKYPYAVAGSDYYMKHHVFGQLQSLYDITHYKLKEEPAGFVKKEVKKIEEKVEEPKPKADLREWAKRRKEEALKKYPPIKRDVNGKLMNTWEYLYQMPEEIQKEWKKQVAKERKEYEAKPETIKLRKINAEKANANREKTLAEVKEQEEKKKMEQEKKKIEDATKAEKRKVIEKENADLLKEMLDLARQGKKSESRSIFIKLYTNVRELIGLFPSDYELKNLSGNYEEQLTKAELDHARSKKEEPKLDPEHILKYPYVYGAYSPKGFLRNAVKILMSAKEFSTLNPPLPRTKNDIGFGLVQISLDKIPYLANVKDYMYMSDPPGIFIQKGLRTDVFFDVVLDWDWEEKSDKLYYPDKVMGGRIGFRWIYKGEKETIEKNEAFENVVRVTFEIQDDGSIKWNSHARVMYEKADDEKADEKVEKVFIQLLKDEPSLYNAPKTQMQK